jgi:hypothetical protein
MWMSCCGSPVNARQVTADRTAVAGRDDAAILADAVAEPNESFALQLLPPVNCRLDRVIAKATIMELAFASLWVAMQPGRKRTPAA